MKYFANSYEEAKIRFIENIEFLRAHWTTVSHRQIPIVSAELSMDVLLAEANARKENLLVLISGVHGIEGYLGSALQRYFCEELLSMINATQTGICLVHSVNPWGMKNFQRNNENNVDLNRSFVLNDEEREVNSGYQKMKHFLQPETPYSFSAWRKLQFYLNTFKTVSRYSAKTLKTATLLGQYEYPDGIYYGGRHSDKSTQELQALYDQLLGLGYENIYLIDLHTGYGPKNEMTIVNSPLETRDILTLMAGFNYPRITKLSADDFYAIHGDMVDYFYKTAENRFEGKTFFATCFEFGTNGDHLLQQLESLRLMIAMNQMNRYGAKNTRSQETLKAQYREIYYPSSVEWKKAATGDFKKAITGFLRHFELCFD